MKERFASKRFDAAAIDLIETCNGIIDEYDAAGFDLSLRQLYYQLVSRNVVPNTENSYKRVGSIIGDARLAGLVDWDAIKDRGRECVTNSHWDSPAEILETAARTFRFDLWETQPTYVEVMVEKQALEGVLMPVCSELDVAFTANKGYSSLSAMYEAGRRMRRAEDLGKRCVVVYLGDHDPSGIDMSRDVADRLCMFARCSVEVDRAALNMTQIRRYNPPPNPAKMTDARAASYVERFGTSSWELDALEPSVLAQLVRDSVMRLRDQDLWDEAVAKQDAARKLLQDLAKVVRKKEDAGEDDEDADEKPAQKATKKPAKKTKRRS